MIKDLKLTENDKSLVRCFVLKDDTAAMVVIPLRKLMPVDYQRLKAIQAKGGEMLKAMRDETLDNGRNALKQYEPLFEIVRKAEPQSEPKDSNTSSADPTDPVKDPDPSSNETETPKPRGRGRPPGSRNKQTKTKD